MRVSPSTLQAIDRMIASGTAIEHGKPAPAPIEEGLSEKVFMGMLLDYAKWRGWLRYHTFNSRKSESGFPDVVLLRAGVLIVAEIKTEDGELSAPQRTWMEAFRAAGVSAYVWRPSDWPAIVELLS